MKRRSTESQSLELAQNLLEESDDWMRKLLARLGPYVPPGRLRVLEIGAAQGRSLIALARQGHEAVGVEPWRAALEVARRLAESEGVEIDIVEGRAESLPFDDAQFDVVLAFSVIEHVIDLEASLREVNRVLKPGGIFWFSTASSLCPHQNEISRFPLFGWYPNPLKLRIMDWAKRERPHLVGYTETPAIHWFTPAKARRKLSEAGFAEVLDRWTLRLANEAGLRRHVLRLVKISPALRALADVAVEGCAYAARKPGPS